MAGKPSKSEAVPEFSSDRLRLLGPLITPRVVELALHRVLTSESFFYKNKLRDGIDPVTAKLALIVALEMNPRELPDNSEEGLLRGVHRTTVGKLKAEGSL